MNSSYSYSKFDIGKISTNKSTFPRVDFSFLDLRKRSGNIWHYIFFCIINIIMDLTTPEHLNFADSLFLPIWAILMADKSQYFTRQAILEILQSWWVKWEDAWLGNTWKSWWSDFEISEIEKEQLVYVLLSTLVKTEIILCKSAHQAQWKWSKEIFYWEAEIQNKEELERKLKWWEKWDNTLDYLRAQTILDEFLFLIQKDLITLRWKPKLMLEYLSQYGTSVQVNGAFLKWIGVKPKLTLNWVPIKPDVPFLMQLAAYRFHKMVPHDVIRRKYLELIPSYWVMQ